MMKKKEQKPPYGLKSIFIKNFKEIKNASLEDVPNGTKWIFLTGKNGYGKTCLLQAMFIGLWNSNYDGGILFNNKPFNITTEKYLYNKQYNSITTTETIINFSNLEIEKPELNRNLNAVIGFGSQRLSILNSQTTLEDEDFKSGNGFSLFFPSGILLNIENKLKLWHYRSKLNIKSAERLQQKYQFVKNIFLKLSPNLAKIEIDEENDTIVYYEKDDTGHQIPEPKHFQELASGNKSIIAMFGDMIIRLFKTNDSITNPSDVEGIVLIDELDIHFHPEWQKKLPQLLSEIFPKIQFIISTHSPILFLGALENSVFIKVNRTAKEGITIEKLDIDIQNLTPNLILSSPIFGFTDIFPITHKKEARIRTEDTMQEVKKNDLIDKRLRSFFDTEKEAELKNIFKVEK